MCEIVIMVKDVIAADPVDDSKMFKRGDLIEVLEDGADWGDHAMSNPRFRMVRLSGISVNQASKYIAREAPTDPLNVSPYLRQRMYSLDLSVSISQAISDFIADDTRATPMLILTPAQVARLVNAITVKAPIPNPKASSAELGRP